MKTIGSRVKETALKKEQDIAMDIAEYYMH